ncbi:MAG TPA: SDR family NAD(P)-dependent oxidoreductase [Polyangiaceae bacterium]|nr:SDR family NAD(P)-dependent oxidoreductase [Polyangiaceae bacterium]
MTTRVYLITGGGTGIGATTARRLLGAGHAVAITGRDASRLEAFAKTTADASRVLGVTGDASDYAALTDAVAQTVARFGRLDGVVANAGFSTFDDFENGDPAKWREMVLTNVLGPALLVKAALPALRSSRGRIVFIGSVAGFKNTPGNMYSVTKWAVTGLAENTRMLVTGDGVGVTLVAPGRVETPFWEGRSGKPEGPLLDAETIAGMIVWALDQPAGVDVNTVIVRPTGQRG